MEEIQKFTENIQDELDDHHSNNDVRYNFVP